MKYLVFRLPCLPEDEGRQHYLGTFATKEEAEAFVQSEVGYFKRGDYRILEDKK